MIPISDNLPNRYFPGITFLLIGFMVVLFLGELKLEATGQLSEFFQSWGITPTQLKSIAHDALAQKNPAAWFFLFFISARSLISSIFLHSSFSQILGNLLFLWVFGKRVEEILKPAKFLGLYLGGGLLIKIFYLFFQPDISTLIVGSTGSVAIIFGAYLVNFPRQKIESILPLIFVYIPVELPVGFYLIWWFIQQRLYYLGQLRVEGGFYSEEISYWLPNIGLLIGAISVKLLLKNKSVKAIN